MFTACTGRPDLDGTMPDSEITVVGEPKRVRTIGRTYSVSGQKVGEDIEYRTAVLFSRERLCF